METDKSNLQRPRWYESKTGKESLPWAAYVLPEDYWAELVVLQQKLIKAEWPHLLVQLITIKCVLECWWGLGHIRIEAIWERLISSSWEPFANLSWEPLIEALWILPINSAWKHFTKLSRAPLIKSAWRYFIGLLWTSRDLSREQSFSNSAKEKSSSNSAKKKSYKSSAIKFQVAPLRPMRRWMDSLEVKDRSLAYFIAKIVPEQCPFAKDILLLGQIIVHVPPLCKLNPLYSETVSLRFRALCFLADECGEDISALL